MTRRRLVITCLLTILAVAPQCGTIAEDRPAETRLTVASPLDESGRGLDSAALSRLRMAITSQLRLEGLDSLLPAAMEVRPRLVQCPGPPNPAALATEGDDGGCLGSVTVIEKISGRVAFAAVARTPPGGDLTELGKAMAQSVARSLHRQSTDTAAWGEDITGTGKAVRYLGNGRFLVGDETIDLHAIRYAHDPAVDADVPQATNVTLDDIAAARTDKSGQPYAVITLYQVDPPLTGLPSREPGVDRGMDFRDPVNLVKAAYSNYVSPVLTDDPVPVRVASHPIGHFFVKVEVPGYPTVLTGMTTIARADTELVDLTVGRQLGVGGVLLTPQPGRLNSSAEVARELALRERRLRVVDGLYFRMVHGQNAGPEYAFDDGRVLFARVLVPVKNATDALAYFAEFIQRGEQNRFGSLLNGPFKGTGAGCSAFALSWLQAAGVIPFIAEPAPGSASATSDAVGPNDFWRTVRSHMHIPWRLIGCDERVGATLVNPAELTIYDLLFHGETTAFIRKASEGLAAHVRASYGTVAATLFQIGALTPVRDLVINARRKDPEDRADYTWSGPGLDFSYWDNSRFAAWIGRVWATGPHDPHVKLAREGRFIGLEIDATVAPRQHEAFFAAADRLSAMRANGQPLLSCQDVFDQGLE